MQDCIFCKIIKGEIPSSKVFEDDDIIAFKDISPKAPVHVLVAPKKHIDSLRTIKTDDQILLGKLLLTIKIVAEKLAIAGGGYKVVVNNGKDTGQLVFHLHFHILGGWRKNPNWEV